MAKIIDITEKLAFNENPKIKVKNKTFEVNSDAKTVLGIMGDLQNKSEIQGALGAYEKLFSEKDRETIDTLNLSFNDLTTLIQTAISLVTGAEDEEEGE